MRQQNRHPNPDNLQASEKRSNRTFALGFGTQSLERLDPYACSWARYSLSVPKFQFLCQANASRLLVVDDDSRREPRDDDGGFLEWKPQ